MSKKFDEVLAQAEMNLLCGRLPPGFHPLMKKLEAALRALDGKFCIEAADVELCDVMEEYQRLKNG